MPYQGHLMVRVCGCHEPVPIGSPTSIGVSSQRNTLRSGTSASVLRMKH